MTQIRCTGEWWPPCMLMPPSTRSVGFLSCGAGAAAVESPLQPLELTAWLHAVACNDCCTWSVETNMVFPGGPRS